MGKVLDIGDLATISELSKRNSQSVPTRTSGPTDSVNIILSLHWKAVIEDVTDTWNIDTASSNIGCNQNLHLSVA